MSNQISFITANFVARQMGYQMSTWGEAARATSDYFMPVTSYAQRFGALLQEIADMEFSALDLWSEHLHPSWATEEHISIATDLLQEHELTVVSFAGNFGATAEEVERTCRLCVALGVSLLGGSTTLLRSDRATLVAILRHHGLRFGLENHHEKSTQQILDEIGERDEDVIGVTADTGWFGTYAIDAPAALQAVADRLFHVHLKDVLAAGGHETCRFGRGVVAIGACVETLQQIGYLGAIAVEHEPEHFDPTEDILLSKTMLTEFLAAG